MGGGILIGPPAIPGGVEGGGGGIKRDEEIHALGWWRGQLKAAQFETTQQRAASNGKVVVVVVVPVGNCVVLADSSGRCCSG